MTARKSAQLTAHPVADLFPMLADDELQDMAADIAERGLLQAIVLDSEGRILDGRDRYAACQISKVKPHFETYDGDDPAGYALAVNIQRRSLTASQRHMIREQARRQAGAEKVQISTSDAEAKRLSDAATVLDHAPDLAPLVVAGDMPLYKAVDEARQRKARARTMAEQGERLRQEAPDLADRVADDDDRLTVSEAMAILESRRTDEQRQRERDAQERRGALQRYVDTIQSFLAGWETAIHMAADPARGEVLDLLPEYDRERFLEIEKRYLT